MNNEAKLNYDKLKEAFEKQIKIHIILKDRTWRNGFVIDLGDSVFIIKDKENGDEPIFLIELAKVEVYQELGR